MTYKNPSKSGKIHLPIQENDKHALRIFYLHTMYYYKIKLVCNLPAFTASHNLHSSVHKLKPLSITKPHASIQKPGKKAIEMLIPEQIN